MWKYIQELFVDRKHRLPRIWSNAELKKYAHHFSGYIINVSAWKDIDKEGNFYRDYFINASSYTVSNYLAETRGLQGSDNEILLDLTQPLPLSLIEKFDLVYNHTVLEHVYEIHAAFENLCLLSKDIVLIVVPFLQPMHCNYGDFWRFTPLTIKKMFEEHGLTLLYLSFNNHRNTSVYIFAIASKYPSRWSDKITDEFSFQVNNPPKDGFEPYIGCHAINNIGYVFKRKFVKLSSKLNNID